MDSTTIKSILDKHQVENSEALSKALAEILPLFLNSSIDSIDEQLAKNIERKSRRMF